MNRACRHCHSPARQNPCWSRRFGAVEKECVREDREALVQCLQDRVYERAAADEREDYEREWISARAAAQDRRRRRGIFWRETFYYAMVIVLMSWTIGVMVMTHP